MTTNSDSIRFVTLPPVEISSGATSSVPFISKFLKAQILLVRDAVHVLTRSNSVRLAEFVIDMLCTHMIGKDVMCFQKLKFHVIKKLLTLKF
ncbi:hypothetical protein PVL29_015937 [Vitis rotundifolia]|uniref:Uncharacterized protein n=1 Tax=Vitis rotundifolia TaxID=103349 RepID=A0AA38ZE50_VITRO|nr:hypothetical protein PVL29_015904 [Vitis rotundifolia]KAJ9687260.1 hypothetical protein PVL29_015937 [Vitis rotundifolia]